MTPKAVRHESEGEIGWPHVPISPPLVSSLCEILNHEHTPGCDICVWANARLMLIVWTAGTAHAAAPAAAIRRSA
jgi:hypothetical protein